MVSGCQVAALMNGSEQIGTAFKTNIGNKFFAYLTAGHAIPLKKQKNFVISYRCGDISVSQKVLAVEKLAGIDVSILRPATDISEMPIILDGKNNEAGDLGEKPLIIPNYSGLSDLDANLKNEFIFSRGVFIAVKENKIYFTADIIKPGASGAPILNKNGRVIGVVTGRLLEKNGVFSGVGYGVPIQQVFESFTVGRGGGATGGL